MCAPDDFGVPTVIQAADNLLCRCDKGECTLDTPVRWTEQQKPVDE